MNHFFIFFLFKQFYVIIKKMNMNVNQKVINMITYAETWINKNPNGKYMVNVLKEVISLVYKEHYLLLWVFFASLYMIQIISDSQIYSILDSHRLSIDKLKEENRRLRLTLEKMLQDEEAKQENIYMKELNKVKVELNRDYEKRMEVIVKSLEKKLSTQKARITKMKKSIQDKIEELEDNLSIVDLREDSDEESDNESDHDEE